MSQKEWFIIELPVLDYRLILGLQERLVQAKISGEITENILIILEHKPVFTLGYRGGLDNLKISSDYLKKSHIDLVETRRGGNITYHGPGQLIAYPIVSLDKTKLNIPRLINLLEEVMLQTALDFGVKAKRSQKNPGIWLKEKKLGSVGISVRRWISSHGLALNINPDLTPFSWINPCGLQNITTTSIAQESEISPEITSARKHLTKHLTELFEIQQQPIAKLPDWLQKFTHDRK